VGLGSNSHLGPHPQNKYVGLKLYLQEHRCLTMSISLEDLVGATQRKIEIFANTPSVGPHDTFGACKLGVYVPLSWTRSRTLR